MVLRLYNSYTNKKEDFKPIRDNKVRMYSCGPTVYGNAHIGNFRAYTFVDLLKRFLLYKGFEVIHAINITDVGHLTGDSDEGEDKLEVASRKENKHPLEIAKFYTEAFLKDWKLLNLKEPNFRPKATEYIKEMIDLVRILLEKGYAYQSGPNVYFDITKFQEYGKLSGNKLEELTKSRVGNDENKKHAHDFVLWFGESKFKNHILKWESPWGEGYPGWHAECSVMSAKTLTPAFNTGNFIPENFKTIDIHTGGIDNKFPHHECEIAQTEGATGKKFANFWLHNAHLGLAEGKMSKSLGNVYTISELVEEGYSPRAIRYLLLATHYRQRLIFSKDLIISAQKSLERLDEVLRKLKNIYSEKSYNETLALEINGLIGEFESFLDDDLNISGAMGAFFDIIRITNAALQNNIVGKHQADEIIKIFFNLDTVLGIIDESILESTTISDDIQSLVDVRAKARQDKNWAESDRIRDLLKEKGYQILDSKDGQQIKKI